MHVMYVIMTKLCSIIISVHCIACINQDQQIIVNQPSLNIELTGSQKEGDNIASIVTGDSVILTIQSRMGIGSAKLGRKQNNWPGDLIIRFQLRGLESCSVNNGKVVITTSVSSHQPFRTHCTARMLDSESAAVVQDSAAYWMPATIVPEGDAIATIPLTRGYFEVSVPDIIFQNNPDSLEIVWVDFFR